MHGFAAAATVAAVFAAITCPYCGLPLDTEAEMEGHFRLACQGAKGAQGQHRCTSSPGRGKHGQQCACVFQTRKALKDHVKFVHTPNSDGKFNALPGSDKAQVQATRKKPCVCGNCGMAFPNFQSWRKHFVNRKRFKDAKHFKGPLGYNGTHCTFEEHAKCLLLHPAGIPSEQFPRAVDVSHRRLAPDDCLHHADSRFCEQGGYRCTYGNCAQKFPNLKAACEHTELELLELQQAADPNERMPIDSAIVDEDLPCACLICGRGFEDLEALRVHLWKEHGGQWSDLNGRKGKGPNYKIHRLYGIIILERNEKTIRDKVKKCLENVLTQVEVKHVLEGLVEDVLAEDVLAELSGAVASV